MVTRGKEVLSCNNVEYCACQSYEDVLPSIKKDMAYQGLLRRRPGTTGTDGLLQRKELCQQTEISLLLGDNLCGAI